MKFALTYLDSFEALVFGIMIVFFVNPFDVDFFQRRLLPILIRRGVVGFLAC